jgi:proteic killer suppression protein
MEVRFDDRRLLRMALEIDYDGGFSHQLAAGFRDLVQFITDARDERELYAWKALHFERLKGRRRHPRSMRLNKQFRLIVEIEVRPGGNLIAVKSIEDYH